MRNPLGLFILFVLVSVMPVSAGDRETALAKASESLAACAQQGLRSCSSGYRRERESVATLVTEAWIPDHLVSATARERACESLRMSGGLPRALPSGEDFVACN